MLRESISNELVLGYPLHLLCSCSFFEWVTRKGDEMTMNAAIFWCLNTCSSAIYSKKGDEAAYQRAKTTQTIKREVPPRSKTKRKQVRGGNKNK